MYIHVVTKGIFIVHYPPVVYALRLLLYNFFWVLIVLISIPAAVSELSHSFVPTAFISLQLFAAAKYNTIQYNTSIIGL